MEQKTHQCPVALIVGVTGMVGLSLAEALKKPTALKWKVYGASRREMPIWFPAGIVDQFISFDATDAADTTRKLSPISGEVTHIFWVAIQVRENEEANVKVNKSMLVNVVNVLSSCRGSKLTHITLQTGTQYYMGPVHDQSYSGRLFSHDPPFCEDLPRLLSYPNFYYPLEDLVASLAPSITYSIHRSSIIIGASSRSVYNTLLTLSMYAIICRHQGLSFKFPGTRYSWEHFCDMSDARVLADQHIWASVTVEAKNQAYNCTNGDVFTWKSIWKVLSDIFGLEFVEFDEGDKFDFVEMMRGKGTIWDEIVEINGLYKTKLEEVTCFEALHNVLNFKFQHVCSMNKSREFGFFGYADTPKSIGMWVEKLREMKILP